MSKKYNVDYFIEKFEAIPSKNWTTKKFYDPDNLDKCCALGHCGVISASQADTLPEAKALRNLFWEIDTSVFAVNDNSRTFKEKTPKLRILAALKKIKRKLKRKK